MYKRQLRDISERQVLKLAEIDCSYAEMAAVLDCGVSLLKDRFRLVIEKGLENGKASLKRAQWKKAVTEGNPAMLIFLGKNRLGQTDQRRLEVAGDPLAPIMHEESVVFYYPYNQRNQREEPVSFSRLAPQPPTTGEGSRDGGNGPDPASH